MEAKTYSLEEIKKRSGLYRTYNKKEEIKTGAFLFKSENGVVTYSYEDEFRGSPEDAFIFRNYDFVEVEE